MKNLKYWSIQTALFVIYMVLVYNLTIQNLWLSFFMAILMVSVFSSANKIGFIDKTIKATKSEI